MSESSGREARVGGGGPPSQTRSDMLAREKVGRLLLKLSVPAMIGMMVHAIYNVVNAIFVGRYVGTLGIGGVAVAMPVHMVVMSIGAAIGMGGASIISRRMGSGDQDGASLTLGNMVFLALASGLLCLAAGLSALRPIIGFFGANEALYPYCRDYLSVLFLGSPLITFTMVASAAVRSEGNARVAMGSMLLGGVVNIFLDALFIIVWGMGVKGAAVATVLSMMVSTVYLVAYFLGGWSEITFRFRYLRLKGSIVKEIFIIGLSDFARMTAMSLTAALFNNTLRVMGGEVPIAVFGIYFRINSFFFMPMIGIAQGAQPIIGFNYGAKQQARVKRALRLANISSSSVALAGFALFMLFPEPLIRLFSHDPELVRIGVRAIRILSVGLPLVGYQMIAASFFQALGRARPALFISLSRQVLFLIPLVLILPRFLGLTGAWMSFPLSDAVSFVMAIVLVTFTVRHLS